MPTIEITEESRKELQEILAAYDRTKASDSPAKSVEEFAELAIDKLHASLFGIRKADAPSQKPPFQKLYSERAAEAVLREVSATNFQLDEAFRYVRPGREIVVKAGDATDLASVPGFLTWLIPRYGRHTLSALMHDQLVFDGMKPNERAAADILLRDSMGQMQVPFIRRWLMWGGVTLATQLIRSWFIKAFTIFWVVIYAAGGLHILASLISLGTAWHVSFLSAKVALLWLPSPLLLAALWGKLYRGGLISAWALIALPASVIGIGFVLGLYLLAEGIAIVLLKLYNGFGKKAQVNPVRQPKPVRRPRPAARALVRDVAGG
jgi:hypothetical protein